MALTYSRMMSLGTQAPYFELAEPMTGKTISFGKQDLGSPILVMFICNHCPYVKHIKTPLAELCSEFIEKGLKVFAINSNDAKKYPADSADKMIEDAKEFHYAFPYLFDESQNVAHAYSAACTPEFFVFDQKHRLLYSGQFDSTRPNGEEKAHGSSLREALNGALLDRAPLEKQLPSMGCNIKWIINSDS